MYFSLFTGATFSASSFHQAKRRNAPPGSDSSGSEPATRGNTYDYILSLAAAFTRPGSNIVASSVFIHVSARSRGYTRWKSADESIFASEG